MQHDRVHDAHLAWHAHPPPTAHAVAHLRSDGAAVGSPQQRQLRQRHLLHPQPRCLQQADRCVARVRHRGGCIIKPLQWGKEGVGGRQQGHHSGRGLLWTATKPPHPCLPEPRTPHLPADAGSAPLQRPLAAAAHPRGQQQRRRHRRRAWRLPRVAHESIHERGISHRSGDGPRHRDRGVQMWHSLRWVVRGLMGVWVLRAGRERCPARSSSALCSRGCRHPPLRACTVPTRSHVGLRPTTPQWPAGIRMLPPPSVPAGPGSRGDGSGGGDGAHWSGGGQQAAGQGRVRGQGAPCSAARPALNPPLTHGKGTQPCGHRRAAARAAAACVVRRAVRVAGGAGHCVEPGGAQAYAGVERRPGDEGGQCSTQRAASGVGLHASCPSSSSSSGAAMPHQSHEDWPCR